MIRPLNEKDKEIFITLAKEFYNSDAVIKPLPQDFYPFIFDKLIKKNSTAKGFIIEYDGKICGYGVVNLTFSMEAGGDTLWLEDLYIRKDFRNKGLGKEYFNFIFKKYKKVKRFRLEVEESNPKAIKLYKSFGFDFLEYKQMILDKF